MFFIHCTWKHKGWIKWSYPKNLQDTDPVQWQYLPRYVVYIHSLWTQTADVTVVALHLPRGTNEAWGREGSPKGKWNIPKYVQLFQNKVGSFYSFLNMAFSCASLWIIFIKQSILFPWVDFLGVSCVHSEPPNDGQRKAEKLRPLTPCVLMAVSP